jgi:hypothetical protein
VEIYSNNPFVDEKWSEGVNLKKLLVPFCCGLTLLGTGKNTTPTPLTHGSSGESW